jgi:hypothetical protein
MRIGYLWDQESARHNEAAGLSYAGFNWSMINYVFYIQRFNLTYIAQLFSN